MQHLRAQARPLLPLAVETVNVEHHRFAKHPRNIRERAVGHVAQQDDIVVAEGDMHRPEKGADPGVEVLLVQAGHDDAAHPAIVNVVGTGERAAAIDRDAVAVISEARGDLLGKALEAAITIGNAPSSDDGDVHEKNSTWQLAVGN